MDTQPEKMADRQLRTRNILLAITTVLLAVIALMLIVRFYFGETAPNARMKADARAIQGVISGRTPQEIQAMLDTIVQEGMFNVSINGQITVGENKLGNVCIENIAANRYVMRVDILVTDSRGTEVTVYESGTILPGYCIETGDFKVLPPMGYTDALAVFTALEPETLAEVGRTNVAIILIREGP